MSEPQDGHAVGRQLHVERSIGAQFNGDGFFRHDADGRFHSLAEFQDVKSVGRNFDANLHGGGGKIDGDEIDLTAEMTKEGVLTVAVVAVVSSVVSIL